MQLIRSHRIAALVVSVIFVVGLSGGAWAISRAGSDIVKGCVAKKGGALRISSKCKSSERPISWHKSGVQGAPGAISNLDSLAGLPCEVGTANEGNVELAKNEDTGVQSIICVPDSGTLESTAQLQPGEIDPTLSAPSLFAWMTPTTHQKLNVLAEFHRFIPSTLDSRYERFNDDLLYEVHIARGNSLADVVTYQFDFNTPPAARVDPASAAAGPGGGKEPLDALVFRQQRYTVTKVVGSTKTVVADNIRTAPPNIGPHTRQLHHDIGIESSIQTTYNNAFSAEFIQNMGGGSEGRVWAGPRDEAENFDMAALRDLFNVRAGVDSFAHQNALDVVLELPTQQVFGFTESGQGASDANTLAIWISVSVPVVDIRGDTVNIQIARSGFPSFEDFFIGEQDRGLYTGSTPSQDVSQLVPYLLNPVLVRDAEATQPSLFPAGQPDNAKKFNRTDLIDLMMLKNVPSVGSHDLNVASWGDVLRLDMGTDSSWPNGRPIEGGGAANVLPQNAQNLMLNYLLYQNFGVLDFQAGVTNDRDYLNVMPWAPIPWSAY
jgi:hypothetical protein